MGSGYVRLTQPMVRENGVLRPASWEEALDRAAAGFAKASTTVSRQVDQATGVLLTPEPDLIGVETTYLALTAGAYERARRAGTSRFDTGPGATALTAQ